jgi:hypothetical protein
LQSNPYLAAQTKARRTVLVQVSNIPSTRRQQHEPRIGSEAAQFAGEIRWQDGRQNLLPALVLPDKLARRCWGWGRTRRQIRANATDASAFTLVAWFIVQSD